MAHPADVLPRRRPALRVAVLAAAAALCLGACTSGDPLDDTAFAGLSATSSDEALSLAAEQYADYVRQQADLVSTETARLTDAMAAGDLAAARSAYGPSRSAWSSIAPLAPVLGVDPARMDAPADVESPDSRGATGWHRLEWYLYSQNSTKGAEQYVSDLEADVAALVTATRDPQIPPAAVPIMAEQLAAGALADVQTSGSHPWSAADLWDVGGRIEGARAAFIYLSPRLNELDTELRNSTEQQFFDANGALTAVRGVNNSWQPWCPSGAGSPGCEVAQALDPEATQSVVNEIRRLHDRLVTAEELLNDA